MKNIKIIQQLHDLGITGYEEVVYNPSYEVLFKAEMSTKNKGFEKGALTDSGAVAVKTGNLELKTKSPPHAPRLFLS